jgi:glutamate synthase (NADPH/NADH)
MFVRVMPLDYKRVLQEQAAAAAEEKKRQSVIDLIPSQTASQVDLVATGFDTTLSLDSNPVYAVKAKPSEPQLADLEDSMNQDTDVKDKLVKLDKVRGFMKYKRLNEPYRPPRKRVKDWKEISTRLNKSELKYQTARCMDCGVPFCQSDTGCPIGNLIPQWNDLVFKDKWKEALDRLMLTNNLPEVTGRV